MKQKWNSYLFWILLAETAGFLAVLETQEGMAHFQNTAVYPSFTPPAALFQSLWPPLYALMGTGAARVWLAAPRGARQTGINLFLAQLIFQYGWSLLFFNDGAYGLSLYWLAVLWILVLLMVLAFRKADKLSALLQVPCFLWVTFTGALNFTVWQLNR